jgi:hypothetical protein
MDLRLSAKYERFLSGRTAELRGHGLSTVKRAAAATEGMLDGLEQLAGNCKADPTRYDCLTHLHGLR